MFDLITGNIERPFREPAPGSKVISLAVHAVFVTLIAGIPLLHVVNELPEVPTIMAFVATPVAAPPPPPPPLKGAARPAARPELDEESSAALAAPTEAPSGVKPEPMTGRAEGLAGVEGGVEGGIEGGVPGGIVGGIVGGLVPPAPPPLRAAARPAPVRIGGQIEAPALLHRVDPEYPDIAAATRLTGMVILEAVVDADGCVESVKVLRSRHAFLDRAAIAALKQWQYSPLVLNGVATPFVLTVTFNFSVGP